MQIEDLYAKRHHRLEDFWARRENRTRFVRQAQFFDRTFTLSSNHQQILSAIDHCLPLYSKAPPARLPPFSIQLAVHAGPLDPGTPPDDLMDQIQYTGDANWLMMQLGRWGHCHVHLEKGEALAVLAPQLARQPELVARCLLNTIITNFFVASGYAMLHASCLYHEGRAVLLMAAHNSGKSTTALRLALAGYPLLSDSMIFLTPASDKLLLLGFPVGRVKLRQDMVPAFPQLQELLAPEMVRGETKYRFDLRWLEPNLVCAQAVSPSGIDLCLLTRGPAGETVLRPASRAAVEASVMENSLFYDTEAVWRRNLTGIDKLLGVARWHHLVVGTDPEQIVDVVGGLWRIP